MNKLGKKTTADEALQGRSLKGKTAIVTGASSGLGVETTRVLALAGADVTLAVRNVEAGEKVKAELEAGLPAGAGRLDVKALDLTDLASVRAFAAASGEGPLDLLINNAGIMAPPLGVTAQGFESQLGTNHLGHFLLTLLLEKRLKQSPAARVVTVSSDLHRRGSGASIIATLDGDRAFQQRKYAPQAQYGDSKLANVLFARGLAKRFPANVEAFSLHPGVIATNLTRTMIPPFLTPVFRAVGKVLLKSVPQGAATTVYAATAPELAEQNGAYLADCAVTQPMSEALDETLIERTWSLSRKAVEPYLSA
ncbi:MAG: SDR family NAD(P)-dependent oxidoreductase [Archangiaceae bacterium]|nr:SDR family NAD(P)-dependent oxidoreductase [Archangiaceae bacterium]